MKIIKIPPLFDFKNIVHILAFGLGSGLMRHAPGTWGSLLGVLIALPMQYFPIFLLVFILIGAFLLGVYLCEKTASDLGVHDYGGIVWDEWVGQWCVLFFLPEWSVGYIFSAFLLFRAFDIVKPFPIKWLDQHVHGGLGIMIDDVLAGGFALSIILMFHHFIG
jgi:phosphatidylglycerophosphatase A